MSCVAVFVRPPGQQHSHGAVAWGCPWEGESCHDRDVYLVEEDSTFKQGDTSEQAEGRYLVSILLWHDDWFTLDMFLHKLPALKHMTCTWTSWRASNAVSYHISAVGFVGAQAPQNAVFIPAGRRRAVTGLALEMCRNGDGQLCYVAAPRRCRRALRQD